MEIALLSHDLNAKALDTSLIQPQKANIQSNMLIIQSFKVACFYCWIFYSSMNEKIAYVSSLLSIISLISFTMSVNDIFKLQCTISIYKAVSCTRQFI